MSKKIIVVGPRDRLNLPKGAVMVNTTSVSRDFGKELSPFLLGPCKLYGDYSAGCMENAWQYCKVYKCHTDKNGDPTTDYFNWAVGGWSGPVNRYPMGKNAIPEYSLWDGVKMDYVEARSKIYVPLYYRAVRNTNAYAKLKEIYQSGVQLYLWDFDGYNHVDLGMTLKQVLNCKDRKMGHAFVLARMLEGGK